MGFFSAKNKFPVNGKTVIVTGGSQGMGKAVAKLLASKGANVVIVARNVGKLEAAIKDIAASAANPQSQRFHYISADLMKAPEAVRIISEVTTWNNDSPPDIVWACAGMAVPTLWLDTPTETLQSQMDNNYFTGCYMAHATINAWIRGKAPGTPKDTPRHFVFTSSFAALWSIAGYGAYSPAKAALRSLHDTLSMELQIYERVAAPVKVHTVFPATILSEGYENENKIKTDLTKKLEEADDGRTPETIAANSLAGLEAGNEMVTCDFLTRLVGGSVLSGSRRSGWGIVDFILGSFMHWVMIIVRWDADNTVKKFAKLHGTSGMKTKE